MKILIVDDSKAMRMIVRRTLRQAGLTDVEVSEACDGKQGLEAVRADQPDIVLSDMNMPEMNGFEFLKELRAEGNQVRFGFVTSEGTDDIKAAVMSEGAEFLITKPFTPEKFEAAFKAEVS